MAPDVTAISGCSHSPPTTPDTTTANAIGVGGIPGILSSQPAYMLSFALCMAIAIVVHFVLTVIVGKKKGVA